MSNLFHLAVEKNDIEIKEAIKKRTTNDARSDKSKKKSEPTLKSERPSVAHSFCGWKIVCRNRRLTCDRHSNMFQLFSLLHFVSASSIYH
jgi:hypothetical protein